MERARAHRLAVPISRGRMSSARVRELQRDEARATLDAVVFSPQPQRTLAEIDHPIEALHVSPQVAGGEHLGVDDRPEISGHRLEATFELRHLFAFFITIVPGVE
jgi:hypothetical protein